MIKVVIKCHRRSLSWFCLHRDVSYIDYSSGVVLRFSSVLSFFTVTSRLSVQVIGRQVRTWWAPFEQCLPWTRAQTDYKGTQYLQQHTRWCSDVKLKKKLHHRRPQTVGGFKKCFGEQGQRHEIAATGLMKISAKSATNHFVYVYFVRLRLLCCNARCRKTTKDIRWQDRRGGHHHSGRHMKGDK